MISVIVFCAIVTVSSVMLALKKYVDMLIVISIMERRGIEPDDDEMKDAAWFVIKNLLKLR